MRGYFGFGAEGISKPMNMGNLVRSAHAFGAQFVFTVSAHYSVKDGKSDTSKAPNHLPWYDWDNCEDMVLPNKCKLVGVELIDDAIELPSFHHPKQAAYILGPEMGSLSDEMMDKFKTFPISVHLDEQMSEDVYGDEVYRYTAVSE